MDRHEETLYLGLMARRFLLLAAAAFLALPTAAAACDLDGLPGFHRANPFSGAPMFRGAPAQPQPGSQNERATSKPQQGKAPAGKSEPRPWERDDNFGPISPEDKATFT
jgi:hypothetical protein